MLRGTETIMVQLESRTQVDSLQVPCNCSQCRVTATADSSRKDQPASSAVAAGPFRSTGGIPRPIGDYDDAAAAHHNDDTRTS